MIVSWSTAPSGHGMSEDILAELASLVSRHPWFQARASLAIALLERMDVRPPARVLDAGCGWGLTLAALERRHYQAVGLDVSRRALNRLDRPDRRLIQADLAQPIPAGVEPYDAVLALDVIEHVDDDRTAVARLAQLIRPGGVAVVSVPALPELFSEFDVVQGHRRRYLPASLREAFADTDLAIERMIWWGSWMAPLLRRQRARYRGRRQDSPAYIYRQYLELPPWPASLALRLAFRLEHQRTLRGRPRTGTSLFALARRRG